MPTLIYHPWQTFSTVVALKRGIPSKVDQHKDDQKAKEGGACTEERWEVTDKLMHQRESEKLTVRQKGPRYLKDATLSMT